MYRPAVLAVLFADVCLPAPASEPGQALDCSDFVFLPQGLSCSSSSFREGTMYGSPFRYASSSLVISDNQARLVALWRHWGPITCGSTRLYRYALVAYSNGVEDALAYLDDRCVNPLTGRVDRVLVNAAGPPMGNEQFLAYLSFDAVNGVIRIPLGSACTEPRPTPPYDEIPCLTGGYSPVEWMAAIGGFAPLLEIAQSYHPVGLALNYVTAVTHQGQRRYGRQARGFVLSERDPLALPARTA